VTATSKILVVEDEAKIAKLLDDYLQQAGYATHLISHGDEVLEWVENNPVDLILLDLMLPGKDGIEICREVRNFSSVPIIMTTARVEEIDRLLGLELGADDYICKPYSLREVIARVRAVLRRSSMTLDQKQASKRLQIDEAAHEVCLDEQVMNLTRVEFRLLSTLMKKPGTVCTRNNLMNNLYEDYRVVSDRTIDTHVKNLRKKLADILPDEELIRSVYGLGYILELPI